MAHVDGLRPSAGLVRAGGAAPSRAAARSSAVGCSTSRAAAVLPASGADADASCSSRAAGFSRGAAVPAARAARRPGVRVARAAEASGTFDATDEAALYDYVCSGPLLQKVGLDAATVKAQMPTIVELGRMLAKNLRVDYSALTPSQMVRVFHYYLPTFMWCEAQLKTRAKAGGSGPIVIGISAPQGCGKTTIVEQLEALFIARGTKCASVSIDDFYLTGAGQDALAAAFPTNELLQSRGNAGSHDLPLATGTLKALRGLTDASKPPVPVPRYDKSLRGGRGDRAPAASWPAVQGPLGVVLLEGWNLGFKPLPAAAAAAVDPALGEVNRRMAEYESSLHDAIDAWMVVRIGDPQWVYKWRQQAEDQMAASGKPGMSPEQVKKFVARFMPAYQAYLPALYRDGPGPGGKPLLQIALDEGRSPLAKQP